MTEFKLTKYVPYDGPVPPMPCTEDFILNVDMTHRAVNAMLAGAPMDMFEWETDSGVTIGTPYLYHSDELLARNLRSLERWESRQEEKRQAARKAKPPRDIEGDERDRALGILQWAEDRLAGTPDGQRDGKTTDCIYFLGKYVNDGHLTRTEVTDAVLRASYKNKHYPENKSINQIESDVDRGLAKAATDGIHVDWDQMDRWNR